MSTNLSIQSNEKAAVTGTFVRLLPRLIASVLVMAAILFTPAGRPDWVMGWVFIGVHAVYFTVNLLLIVQKQPDLIAERSRIVTEDTKGWDKVFTILASPLLLGAWVVSGLNVRFGWSPQPGLPIQLAALVLMVLGYGLFSWAMISNPFFSRVVRIQDDRGHSVATGGPYRYVRHPGYVGFAVASLATPLALGSLWALIPAGLVMVTLIARTALEDRTLQQELDGYNEYASRVRYRLLPGIW